MKKIFSSFALTVVFLNIFSPTFAATITVNSSDNSTIILSPTNTDLIITSSGDLTGGVAGLLGANYNITVNAASGAGIRVDGGQAIQAILGTLNLSLNSGEVSSNRVGGDASGTIVLSNSDNAGNNIFNIAAGAILKNTGAESGSSLINAINYINLFSGHDATVTVTNAGSITTTDAINASAIRLEDNGGASTLVVTNSGLISAGTNGKAINLLNANSGTINNSGSIVGGIFTTSGALNITNSGSATISGNINLGSSASSSLAVSGGLVTGNLTFGNSSQTLNLSGSGVLTGAISGSGSVEIGPSASLNLNAGTLNASVNGSAFDAGTLNINSGTAIINSEIGQTHQLATFNIGSASQVQTLGNISAASMNLGGTLDLQKTAGNNLTGNLIGNGSGTLVLNEASHNLSGNLTLTNGDILSTTITNPTSAGKLTVSGSATTNSGTLLKVALGGATTTDGNSYTLIDAGNGSSLTAISNSNINVDNSGSNRVGKHVFSTSVSGNDLILDVNRYTVSELSHSTHSSAYNAIIGVDSPTGSLLALQDYLDSESNTAAQKSNALAEASSQVDNSNNRLVFDNISAASNLISTRLDTVRNSNYSGLSSGDGDLTRSIWAEVFGANANQNNRSGYEGYKAGSSGLAFGFDKKIDDELTLGIAGIYAHSNIKSNFSGKRTDIDNYQINLYGSRNFEEYFINGVLGAGLNQYHSNRRINVAQVTAGANYKGQSYSARIELGTNKKLDNDYIITPTIMLTAAKNSSDSYSETGAGTLNFHVNNDSTNFLEGRAGSAISKKYKLCSGNVIVPSLSVSYGYDFIGDRQKTTNNFIGQTTTFGSSSAKVAQGSLRLGAGMKIYDVNNFMLNAEYNFDHRSGYDSHMGSLRGRYNF